MPDSCDHGAIGQQGVQGCESCPKPETIYEYLKIVSVQKRVVVLNRGALANLTAGIYLISEG